MKRILLLLSVILLCCFSCLGQQKKERAFQLPEVPATLDTPQARATFVCEHYWDHFDFADTAYIHLPDITEQALVNFMDLMPRVSQELAAKSLSILYGKTAVHPRMLWYFWETMTGYWTERESPLRNEDMFILMCRSIESIPQIEEVLKIRASDARKLAEKNRVGCHAEDFSYTLATGKQGRLTELEADYTLIFFYQPDCHTCMEIKNAMKRSLRLKDLVSNGRMKVLTMYPGDDVMLWQNHLGELSDEWTNGYDKGQFLMMNQLYDLSSVSSFYLLDKDKRVLLKDADWRQVLQFFEK